MSETIEITAGKNGEYIAVFDGQVLELFGQSRGSARYRASHVIFARERSAKDGSTSVRVYTASGEGWQSMAFGPENQADGERLIAALLAAGAKEVT